MTESDRISVHQEYNLGMNRTMELVCNKYCWPCMTQNVIYRSLTVLTIQSVEYDSYIPRVPNIK